MTWITIDELAQDMQDRAAWEARVESCEVEWYQDPRGRCWIWQEPVDLQRLAAQLQALGIELGALSLAPSASGAGEPAPDEAPTEQLGRPEPQGPESIDRATRLLQQVDARWSGSERELERAAGLPKAFLAKAKRGERGGPRSLASWDRLEAFLGAA
ncbi:MAG: hypothetical protein AB7N76_36430 [Planctomycetota bacterium]